MSFIISITANDLLTKSDNVSLVQRAVLQTCQKLVGPTKILSSLACKSLSHITTTREGWPAAHVKKLALLYIRYFPFGLIH